MASWYDAMKFNQGVANEGLAGMEADKYKAAVGQATDLWQQGDLKGAATTLFKADPNLAVQTFQKMFAEFEPANNPELQGKLALEKSSGAELGQLGTQTQFGSNPRQLLDARLANDEKLAGLRAAVGAENAAAKPTVGETALDKKFAQTYESFIVSGGAAKARRNLAAVGEVVKNLDKTDKASGPLIGSIPKWARDIVAPEGSKLQDSLESVVQQTLKDTLGGQFAALEAKELLARAYNPRLSESENKKRSQAVLDELRAAVDSKVEAARYFEDHGSLRGYKGTELTPEGLLERIDKKIGGSGSETKEIGGKIYKKVKGGWELVK